MPHLQQRENMKIVAVKAKNVGIEEIEGGKNEILNGKNALFKYAEYLKQLKVERK